MRMSVGVSSQESSATATEWGTSSRVACRIFSRISSAARKRSGWSVMWSGGKQGGSIGLANEVDGVAVLLAELARDIHYQEQQVALPKGGAHGIHHALG